MKLYTNSKQARLIEHMRSTFSKKQGFSVIGHTTYYVTIESSEAYPVTEILNVAREFSRSDSRLLESYRACNIGNTNAGTKIILFYFA